MMILLPIRTSIRPWRTPYANYALIVINIVVFMLTYWPHRNPFTGTTEVLRPAAQHLMLVAHPHLWQFITYAFLHGSIAHIVGNMFFLYLFGNNVNDKLGHIGYLCLYLAGAVFSGIGHTLMSQSSVLGASGAVAAVTGAYLVLFPQTLITVFYWLLFFIDTIQIPALYFIGIKLILWDNIFERGMPNVAYDAHLSGYAFGVTAMLIVLATGLISSNHFDLWSMIKQWNRRRRFRDVVSSGYDPYTTRLGTKQVKVKEVKKTPAQQKLGEKINQLRGKITEYITARNLSAAADTYLQLIVLDKDQLLPRQQLLDVANQLASDKHNTQAAEAYEKFLTHYSKYEYTDQVQLMLGILYSRYLDNPKLAIKHLSAAAEKLADPGQRKMCTDELAKLGE